MIEFWLVVSSVCFWSSYGSKVIYTAPSIEVWQSLDVIDANETIDTKTEPYCIQQVQVSTSLITPTKGETVYKVVQVKKEISMESPFTLEIDLKTRCPTCRAENRKSKVYPGACSSTLLGFTPFYDEEGRYHYHNPNTSNCSFQCSNGHQWNESEVAKCHYDEREKILRKLELWKQVEE